MSQSIPFQLLEIEPNSYHLIVNATIANESVKLIVDTGASRSVFDKTYDSGIRVDGISDTVAVGFMSDNVNIEVALFPDLLIDSVKYSDFPIAIADLKPLRELYSKITGLNIAGLLGCDFLVKNVTSINFRTKKIFLKR